MTIKTVPTKKLLFSLKSAPTACPGYNIVNVTMDIHIDRQDLCAPGLLPFRHHVFRTITRKTQILNMLDEEA